MIPATAQIAMGTANLGTTGSRADAFRLLDAYVDMGGGILDTAAVYSDWVPGEARRSETIIGEWLKGRRGPRPMLVTKGGHPPVTDVHHARLDPASIRSDCEISLKALGIERIELYFLHRDDPARPVADIMSTLAELIREGKIAAVGVSNWSAARIAEAAATGLAPIASNQPLGNILSNHMGRIEDPTIHKLDAAAFRLAEELDLSLMLFTSQAQGTLSRRARGEDARSAAYRTPEAIAAADALIEVARETGVEPTNLGVAFLLQASPRFLPIIGPGSIERLHASMAARDIRFAPEVMARIARISGYDRYR